VDDNIDDNPEWVTHGKTIKQLIKELQTFENQDLEVQISVDGGESFKCISLVGKHNNGGVQYCVLENFE
tara:strand:+ start:225 stop:431 length:207 start_codon:yes stop_codon:yes gene_type:complete